MTPSEARNAALEALKPFAIETLRTEPDNMRVQISAFEKSGKAYHVATIELGDLRRAASAIRALISSAPKPVEQPVVGDDVVERVARAIYATKGHCYMDDERMFEPIPWGDADEITRDGCRTEARAALAAIQPEGK